MLAIEHNSSCCSWHLVMGCLPGVGDFGRCITVYVPHADAAPSEWRGWGQHLVCSHRVGSVAANTPV